MTDSLYPNPPEYPEYPAPSYDKPSYDNSLGSSFFMHQPKPLGGAESRARCWSASRP